jgi:hypothetical protein
LFRTVLPRRACSTGCASRNHAANRAIFKPTFLR